MKCRFPEVLIELRSSEINGVGVFALKPIGRLAPIAQGICEDDYKDLILWDSVRVCSKTIRDKINAFCICTPEGFLAPDDNDFNRLSIEWYLNHSCDGNVGFNDDGDFVARRRVAKGEELTYDYGLAESNPRFRMVCFCGSSNCRSVITGNDWKDPVFRAQNLNYMLPRLRRVADVHVAKAAHPRKVAGARRG